MFTFIALIVLAAGPTEPIAPKAPVAAEPKAPVTPSAAGEASSGASKALSPPPLEEAKPTEDGGTKGLSEGPAVLPSLSKKGLCGELLKTGKELALARKKLDDERKAVEAERLALDRLKAEIADSRIQLRAETERLESLLTRRAEGAGGPSSGERTRAQVAPKPQDLDSLAKTMKSMKPESAAALLAKSEPSLGAGVLRRMKPTDAGLILDRVKPDFAAELLALMATIPSAPPSKGARP